MNLRCAAVLSVLISVSNAFSAQDERWQQAWDAFVNDPSMASASVSFCAIPDGWDQPVFAVDPDRMLAPASSQKVLTCATVLDALGAAHAFTTSVMVQGTMEGDVLDGNVVILGGGDPALGSTAKAFQAHYASFLQDWTDAIRGLGIAEITGGVVVDERLFSGEVLSGSTAVADAGNYYGAGAHALSYKRNRYSITFATESKVGSLARVVDVSERIPNHNLICEVTAADNERDNAYVHAVPGQPFQVIRGTIPKGQQSFTIEAAIPQPGLLLAADFTRLLRESGVEVDMEPRSWEALSAKEQQLPLRDVTETVSPPLEALVQHCLRRSDNSFADAFLKHCGLSARSKGTFKAGSRAVRDRWENAVDDLSAFEMVDGSGLSRRNAISSRFLAAVLESAPAEVQEVVETGLKPVKGDTRILAKSGTMGGVRSLTGYLKTGKTNRTAFSLVVNNYGGSGAALRQRMERFLIEVSRL